MNDNDVLFKMKMIWLLQLMEKAYASHGKVLKTVTIEDISMSPTTEGNKTPIMESCGMELHEN